MRPAEHSCRKFSAHAQDSPRAQYSAQEVHVPRQMWLEIHLFALVVGCELARMTATVRQSRIAGSADLRLLPMLLLHRPV